MGTIIYFIGYILLYIIIKKFLRTDENDNEFKDVITTFLISLTSWLGIILIFIISFKDIIEYLNGKIKPPKWL